KVLILDSRAVARLERSLEISPLPRRAKQRPGAVDRVLAIADREGVAGDLQGHDVFVHRAVRLYLDRPLDDHPLVRIMGLLQKDDAPRPRFPRCRAALHIPLVLLLLNLSTVEPWC